jgi:hypothetical protein
LKEAIKGDEWDSPACDIEFTTLFDFQVCEEINFDDIPVGSKIFYSKMMLRKKRDALGVFTSAKAGLVVCANTVAKDLYADVFAPTANEKSMKLLFAIAAILELMFILRERFFTLISRRKCLLNCLELFARRSQYFGS